MFKLRLLDRAEKPINITANNQQYKFSKKSKKPALNWESPALNWESKPTIHRLESPI